MPIDLSNITRSDGKAQAFGLISGLDAKSLINGSLKPLKTQEEEIDSVLTSLSERGEALATLYSLASDISSSSNKLVDFANEKIVMINGQHENNFISIESGAFANNSSFTISDLQIAKPKIMTSKAYSSTNSKIDITPETVPFALPSIIKIGNKEILDNTNQSSLQTIQNPTELVNTLANSQHKDFLNGAKLKNVTINENNDRFAITIVSENNIYKSEQFKTVAGWIPATKMINFYSTTGTDAFSIEVGNTDLSSKDAVRDFSKNLEHDINLISLSFAYHPETIQETAFTSNDVTLFSDNELDELSIAGFLISWNENFQTFNIKTEINGELYTSTQPSGSFQKFELGSIESNKIITINIPGNPITISNELECHQLQDTFNKAFGVNKLAYLTISNDETLLSLSEKINSSLKSIGVKSEIETLPLGEKSILLSTVKPGIQNSFMSLSDNFNRFFYIKEKPQNAKFYYNETLIEKPLNVINDLVLDVEINLLRDSRDQTFNVKIDNNVESLKSGVEDLLDKINKLRIFTSKQREITKNGQFAKTAILQNDHAMNMLDFNLSQNITRDLPNLTNNIVKRLTQIGVFLSEKLEQNIFYNHAGLREDVFSKIAGTNSSDLAKFLQEFSLEISNAVEACINVTSGPLGLETKDLQKLIERRQKDKTDIQERIKIMHEALVKRYADIEEAVIKGNSILKIMELSEKTNNNN